MDKDIEALVKNCTDCQTYKNNPKKLDNHVWETPDGSWQRVHIDFAEPFMGKVFLVLVDAYTKWPEVHIVKNMFSNTTIDILKKIFAQFGIPKVVVSDNGRTSISN